jgi:hypothetical protein
MERGHDVEMHVKNGFFSTRRFGRLMLRELASSYRALLIAMAAVAGAVIVLSALTALGLVTVNAGSRPGSEGFYLGYFINLLFLGGFIVTSLSFREVWHNGGGIFYLTLPGSIFEKLVSKLIMTSVGFGLGSLVFITAVAAVSEGIDTLIFGFGHGMFNPFEPTTLVIVTRYLILQSVFLLGSIWFRKLAFVKTVLWSLLFCIGILIVTGIVGRIALADHIVWNTVQAGGARFGGMSFTIGGNRLQEIFAPGTTAYAQLMVFKTIACVLCYALAPVAWLATYFRLRETEV